MAGYAGTSTKGILLIVERLQIGFDHRVRQIARHRVGGDLWVGRGGNARAPLRADQHIVLEHGTDLGELSTPLAVELVSKRVDGPAARNLGTES